MNFKCEYAGGEGCLCDACQSVRKAIEDVQKITDEEVDKLFQDAERMLAQMEIQESERK